MIVAHALVRAASTLVSMHGSGGEMCPQECGHATHECVRHLAWDRI